MKSKIIVMICVLCTSSNIYAKTGSLFPQKDSKIYVYSGDPKSIFLGNKDINEWGYWQTVNDKNKADFIVDYKVRKTWMISFFSRNMKGYAQITNAKTGEVMYTTKKVNTYWAALGFNTHHQKFIIKKLTRRMERKVE